MNSNFIFETTKVLFWRRLIAQAIDFVLVILTVFVLTIWFRPIGLLYLWVVVWIHLIYSILMDAYRGGTIGKLYMGIRVVKVEEGTSRLLTSFYRNFLKLFIVLFHYDLLLMISRKGYSGFHNRIAKTLVIETNDTTTVRQFND